jgi:hypothetical protein
MFQKPKDLLLPGEKVPVRADKGWSFLKILDQGLNFQID